MPMFHRSRPAGNALRRALVGRGKLLVTAWFLLSCGLVAASYVLIKPEYEATAVLRVEPPRGQPAPADRVETMETQAALATSPEVIETALSRPDVARLPSLAASADSITFVQDRLRAVVPPGTSLIRLTMRGESARDLGAIVRAVAESYKTWTDANARNEAHDRTRRYQEAKRRASQQVDRLRDELADLQAKRDRSEPDNRAQSALDAYRRYRARLSEVQLERIEAEVAARTLADSLHADASQDHAMADARLGEAVRKLYLDDPEVQELHAELKRAREMLAQALRVTKEPDKDPSVVRHRQHVETLTGKSADAWDRKGAALRELLAGSSGRGAAGPDLQQAQLRVTRLRAEETELSKRLAGVRFDTRNEREDALRAQFLNKELLSASESLGRANAALEQMELEGGSGPRVTVYGRGAPAPRVPARDLRPAAMLAGPCALLLALVAAFTLAEAVAGPRPPDGDEDAPPALS